MTVPLSTKVIQLKEQVSADHGIPAGRQRCVRAFACATCCQVPVQMWASSRCRCGPGLDGFAQALVSVDLHSRRFGRRRRHPAHVKATTACCDEPSRAEPRHAVASD
jgi:hypothetical protein